MNAPDHSRQRQQRPLERLVPNPKLKFMEQCQEVMRFHRLALRTEEAYLQWIKRFMVFHREKAEKLKAEMLKVESRNGAAAQQHRTSNEGGESGGARWGLAKLVRSGGAEREKMGWRHLRELGPAEIPAFLTHLASVGQVAASTQNQALNALMFLYREVLHLERAVADFERVRRPARLPDVLAREEVKKVLAAVTPEHQLPLQLLYGTGLRLMKLRRLRVKDIDFERNQIIVHAGKGDTRVSNTGLPLPSHSYSFIPRKRRRFRPQPHGDGSGISILGRLN
jgi:integrase